MGIESCAASSTTINFDYNSPVQTEELKILLALEPSWNISINGIEFLRLPSSEISINGPLIRFKRWSRQIVRIDWLKSNTVRIEARHRFRSKSDVMLFSAGEGFPVGIELRRRRRLFQKQIAPALCAYFGARSIEREMLYADRRFSIGGAYPRFVLTRKAIITVDPDESPSIVNGLMRAAILWAPFAKRPLAAVIPAGRRYTLIERLRIMPQLRDRIEWLLWNGKSVTPLIDEASPNETYVQEFVRPNVETEVNRLLRIAPSLLQAVPDIAGNAISIRLRGIEIARATEDGTSFPLGEPIEDVIEYVEKNRRCGSKHPIARVHQERWLEANLVCEIRNILPSIDVSHVYPQVPSFVGRDRNIIDLLAVTEKGRLVVIEIKASADPDLPFQALDYWIAVERHRRADDFRSKGYFEGKTLLNQPALLILVAPLLAFHKTMDPIVSTFSEHVPLIEIGINQTWKRQIKILRRRGLVG